MHSGRQNQIGGATSRSDRKRRVLIVQTYVPQYRVAFFEGLKAFLDAQNIHLDLVYSGPPDDAARKSDAVRLPWAMYRTNRRFRVGRRELVYQPVARLARGYDLVIVENANKLLINPVLACMNGLGMTRLAYWGHGKNFQGGEALMGASLKSAMLRHAHWWFAYNDLSAEIVRETGFPKERITSVMNTIDNEALARDVTAVTAADLELQRRELNLAGSNVCIYIGGMYDKKRLPFLLAACERIREIVPDFEILFLGSGVDRALVDAFAAKHDWAKALGPTFGRDKATCLKLAKLLLMPGLVGLAIIDAFAAQMPIVTTDVPYHSPEIDYLVSGTNGEIVSPADSIETYAERVAALLADKARLEKLRQGCRESAEKYSMQSMISNFASGVVAALGRRRV